MTVWYATIAVFILLTIVVVSCRVYVALKTSDLIDQIPSYSSPQIIAVFGAGLNPDGTISTVLADRVKKAVDLYKDIFGQTIFLTGAKTSKYGNEVAAMKSLAIALNVGEDNILVDDIGDRSIISCLHIMQQFPGRRVVLVTQKFHLPRVQFIAKWFGTDAIGVSSDLSPYGIFDKVWWSIRELFATTVAVFELVFIYLIKLSKI